MSAKDKSLENARPNQEQQFRTFVENANDIVYTLDPQGRFTYMSPSTKTVLGLDPADLLHTHFGDLLHPDDVAARLIDFAKIVLHGERLNGVEYRVRKGDGSWGWQSSNLGPIVDDAGRVSAVVGVGRDIALRKQAEEKLHRSETRYRLLSDNARDVIWTIAPDATITYVSPSVEQVRGYTQAEAMQQPLDQILTPDSIALNIEYFTQLLADVAAGRKPDAFRGQMEYLCKDGSTYWCDVIAAPILAEDGSLQELLGVSRDISEQKRYENELKAAKEATETLNHALEAANQQLKRMATTDPLTGLWNRRHFADRVIHEMAIADRYGSTLSLLMFDADHFKAVNDKHGHLAGDRVLVALGKRARKLTRATDLPCRWGGEEFLILMPNTGSQDALAVAEKIRLAFASQAIADIGLITASFGVATYLPKESLDDWLNRADHALYDAKQSGRNAVRLR